MQTAYDIRVSVSSKANKSDDKPNEDFYLVDEEQGIYIVADGVTRDRINGIYPNPSPAREVAELFTNTVHRYLKQSNHHKPLERLKHSIAQANEAIRAYNKNYTEFAPSTVAVVALIVDNQFYYAYIGDCSVYRLNPTLTQLTMPQTKRIHEHASEFTTSQIRNDIANNPYHPYAYGIINGDENALGFVEYHQFDLQSGMRILLVSDGLDALLINPVFQYHGQSASDLTKEAEQLEQQNQHLRSDDKTAILIEIS